MPQTRFLETAVQFAQTWACYYAVVIPAKAGIQAFLKNVLDSGVRRNDGSTTFPKA